MRSYILGSTFVALFALSVRAAETHPDWASLKGRITITANNTYLAYEEDMPAINSGKITRITINSGAMLVFSNTTSWITYYTNLFYTGKGTVVKKGKTVLATSKSTQNYATTGTFQIEEGEFKAAHGTYPWGGQTNSALRVFSGATYRHAIAKTRGWCKTYIAGNGYLDQGAFVADAGADGTLAYLVLTDDATLALNTTANVLGGYPTPAGGFNRKYPAELELAGHTLTITGTADTVTIKNDIVSPGEGGAIKFAAGRARTLVKSGVTDFGATKFIAEGDLVLTTGTWTNEVEVLEGAALVLRPSSATTELSVKGPVAGAGNISVGTAEAAALAPVSLDGAGVSISGSLKLYGDCKVSFNGSGALPSVEWTSGSLDVYAPMSAVVTIANEDIRGTSPSWLKFNGEAASVAADGRVLPFGVYISARGDVVPDAPAAQVCIMSEGTGANTGLSKETVSVQSLVNYINGPATIAVNDGETLTAESLSINGDAGDLTIGETGGAGTLASPDGTISVPDTHGSVLTINTSLAANTDVRIDSGTLVLAGGFADTGSVHMAGGKVTMTGSEPFRLGDTVVGTNRNVVSELVLDGANVVTEKGKLAIGARYESGSDTLYDKLTGYMLVTNSTIVAGGASVITVGQSSYGILEVAAGSYVTNRIYLGGQYNMSSSGSQGALYQTGGVVSIPEGDTSIGIGLLDANGYYRIDGGELSVHDEDFGIGVYCPGTLEQRGGKVEYGGLFRVSHANRGRGVAFFRGGTATVGRYALMCQGSQGGVAVVVVEGDADISCPYLTTYQSGNSESTYGYSTDLVFNGGVFRTKGVRRYKSKKDHPLTVNFSGGTWKVAGDNANLFNYGSSVNYTNPVVTAVYEGGMTIDTDGHTGAFASMPISGAYGGGVQSITLGASLSTGYVCPPVVTITGDGHGAVAVADFDIKTRTITGIRVVSPGCGYTTASVSIYRGRTFSIGSPTANIAENANTGSFTKKGKGDFTLRCANTWGGDTILEGGELVLAAAGALPAGTKVIYRGGTLRSSEAASPSSFTADISAAAESSRRIPLITYTDSLPEAAPSIALACDDVSDWRIVTRGLSIVAVKSSGSILLLK